MKLTEEQIQRLIDQVDDEIIRREFSVEIDPETIDLEERSVRVVASTDALDSHEENVLQNWDLERYKKNPVVLWNHNRGGFFGGKPEDSLPIGSSKEFGVKNGRLEAVLRFVDEKANPIAERVWQGFVQRSLRAVSVGFRPGLVTVERDAKGEVMKITLDQNELYEISVVPIPSNPEAVALSADIKARERAALIKRANAQPSNKDDSSMEPEKMKAKLDETEKALEKAAADLVTATARATAAEAELAQTKSALDAANSKLEKATAEAIDREVEDLVGKKIVPTQKADFVEMRTKSPELFKSVVEKLPALNLQGSQLPNEPEPTKNTSKKSKAAASTLLGNAMKAADKARGEVN